MKNRIYPTWEQIKTLKTPPTKGEVALLKYIDKFLSDDWEIFFQPFLNGDRPDIAILNKNVGLMIYEVKDWNPVHYSSKEEFFTKTLKTGEAKKIPYMGYYVNDGRENHRILSPVKQVERYVNNLINLHEPEIGEKIDENRKNFSAFKLGLYFHKMTQIEANSFANLDPKKCTVIGYDKLEFGENSIEDVVPDANRESSISMKKGWYEKIRFWMIPPFHTLEQGTNINLTPQQNNTAISAPQTHQRLRGVAGSGKTLVIAQRAANIASQNKKVLIVTFNITLWHYIRDHVSRARYRFGWEMIEFVHFHGFCKNYLYENGYNWPEQDNYTTDEFLNNVVPETVIRYMKKGYNKKRREYDAILIDEGQDYQKIWYDMLNLFLNNNDELLFVIDEKQNIYGRDNTWVDKMTSTKFRGRWRILNESIRLPNNILEQANRFSNIYLSESVGEKSIPAKKGMQLDHTEPHLIWREVNSFTQAGDYIYRTFEWLTQKGIHPQDIIILVPSHNEGWNLVKLFYKRGGIKINHVFESDDDEKLKKHKMSFWMGDGRLKMSTIHSFKGWELMHAIILTPRKEKGIEELDSLIYTSITRARTNLIVFNRLEKYYEYGQGWPQKWQNQHSA